MKQRKFLSLMFAFAFLLSLLPANVASAADYAGGSGTASSPYLISNLAQLTNFRNNTQSNSYSGTYFKLTADIALGGSSSNQWTPIANDSSYYFKGTFDGDGHKITGLYINNTGSGKTGLFGNIDTDGTVKNFGVSGTLTGNYGAGGVADSNYGVIENCYFTGSITATTQWGGGIVGTNYGTVKNCYNTGNINGDRILGGIVAYNRGGTVENCYNTGSITGTYTGDAGARSGGIVGYNANYSSSVKGLVKNCYNIGTVNGKGYVGGVAALNDYTITNCYYLDTCAAKGTTFTNTDATSLTAAQMKDKSNYSGWDFSSTWVMGSRPLLSSNFEITLTPTTNTYDLDGDGTKDTVYEISTAEQFLDFGAAVNNNNRKLNAVLTKDIDLSGCTWSPIGVYNSDFEGIFDGQNYTISNMKFTTVQHGYNYLTYEYQGLFGVIRNSAVVRNFTVKGDITLAADGQKHIGGVVGLAYEGSKILNVTSYVNITDGGKAYSNINWIGGVAGRIGTDETSGYVDWCKYYGTINVDTAAKVGGIVGCAVKDSYVTNSTNYGKVGWNYIGHIAGVVGSATTGTHVVNCANYGEVSANCHDCIGGVVGYANEYVTINNCLNGGNISGQPSSGSANADAYIGGILGYINNASFAGLTNCFNYGTVKNSGGTDTYVGALVGWLRDGATNVKDNYYLVGSCAKACGGNDGTNNTVVTEIQATSGEIAYKLQGSQSEQVWGQTLSGENYDAFPTVNGSKVYCGTKCNGVVTYANTEVPTSHSYSNGVCQNCGASQTISTNSDGYYQISSKADYIYFTNLVNGGKTGANAVLTADIDLSGYDYIPIGTDGNGYTGTFDGAGHKIENLTMTANDSYMGMFGKTNGATVKNFTVSGNITAVCNTLANIGGVIGLADSTSVSDVISKVNLKDNGKIEHIYRAGGIAAQARYGSSFTNCEYSGDITLHYGSHTTGIVGVASDASKDNPIVIKNCVNKANMKFDTSRRVAGIVGWVDTYTTVSQCANYGNITIKESDDINQAAGIVAVNVGPLTVEDCANYGNITDGKVDSSLGGIVGFLDVYKNAADFGGIKNCFNYGTIANTNANGSTYWGSVIGYIKNDTANNSIASKITNNYYLKNTAPTISGTNGIALTATEVSAEQAASGELAHTLQGTRTDTVWGQTLTGNGTTPYPVPSGDRVYKITFVASDETYATKYANATGIGTLPEPPGDKFAKWLCGNTTDSAEFTATTPVNSDMTVYAFQTDTPQASGESDEITIMSGQNVEIDLRNYVKSQFGNNFKFSVADDSTLPSGLTLADDGYTIVGTTSLIGRYTVKFNVENYNISLFSMNDEGTLLTVTIVVTPAFEGNGTADNPYLIKTTDDLIKFRDQVNGGGTFEGKVIKLATDFDLEGSETNQWTPIGTDTAGFKGTFDGGGHKISGLYISGTSNYQGLFGYVDNGGKVENLSIDGIIKGSINVGGVAGKNFGTITNCGFTGSVGGTEAVGGVAGYSCGTITNCYNTGSADGNVGVGGVVGAASGTITNCYNTGNVGGTDNVGGVVGFNSSTVTNCYNTGSVTGGDYVGGVVGKNHDDYYTYEEGKVEYCYYLNTCAADGTTFTNELGTALTAEKMKNAESFAEWDFENTWKMGTLSPMLISNPEKGTRNAADVVISTLDELKTFRDNVNNGTSYEGKYILLTADIDLGGGDSNQWTPIGTENSQFKGTFDGGDRKISGLYISGTFADASDPKGLFGYVGKGGTVRGLKLDGIVKGTEYVGGVAGKNFGTITNCGFTGSVDGTDYVGGVVGENNGTVENSYNTGSVSGDGNIGGVVGENKNDSTVETSYNTGSVSGIRYVGGVAGRSYGTVETSYNTGSITADVGSVGGVAGENSGTVTNCYSAGSVVGSSYVGGVVGENYSTLTNCYNTGGVDGDGYVGGVVGDNNSGSTVETSYNIGSVSGREYVGGVAGRSCSTVKNCYNTGSVSGSSDVGGVVGYNKSTVTNCYNTGSVGGTDNVGGVVGNISGTVENCCYLDTCAADGTTFTITEGTVLTAEKMKDSSNYTAWDFENTWEMGTFSPMLISNPEKGTKNTATVIITSLDELKTFRDNVNGGTSYEGEYILLTADIDLGGGDSNQWTPIGTENSQFKGTFDGDGHKISGLYILKPDDADQSLFGYVGVGGIVKNLNADGSVAGERFVSGIVGENCGMIENCSFTGNVSSYATTGAYVGGIAGLNRGTIKNCHNDSNVNGANGYSIGGIVGENYGMIENCYNTGSVIGTDKVGGVAGYNSSDATVKNSYNTGSVTGVQYVGGVTGLNEHGTVTNCYNKGSVEGTRDVGGLVGANSYGTVENDGTVKNCYYLDTCAAGGTTFTNTDGTALTTEEMKDQANFKNWDFSGIWTMGVVSPYLKSIPETGTENNPDVVISTSNDLEKFRNRVNGGETFEGKYIILTKDLDLGGSESNKQTPIGTENSQFKGTFDGNGHKISGLYIANTSDLQGLFGYVGKDGTVKDLTVDGSVKGAMYVGGLAGINYGLIENCSFSGNVGGTEAVGGVAGANDGIIENCYNTSGIGGAGNVGGVTGYNEGKVKNCYNTGSVDGSGEYVGGVVGDNKNNGEVINCYYLNTCAADGTTFNNTQGEVLTAAQMKDSANYTDWDFTSTWVMGYLSPMLKSNLEKGTKNAADNVISTLDELKTFRDKVNDGETFEGKYVVLAADFDLKGSETNQWTPIGTADKPFKGTFDGDGYKISGLYIAGASDCRGLFGYIGKSGTVKDLSVDGTVTGEYVGGVAGENYGTITNCTNYADVNGNGTKDYVGGISGKNYGTIKNCRNYGNAKGTYDVGGIAGDNESTITNCSNMGKVESKNATGGVTGANNKIIEMCYNVGTVTGEYDVGGIAGGNYNGAAITNCYNTGSIGGEAYVGGIAGGNYSEAAITNCYNTGSIGGEAYVGGLVGANSYGTVTNCYYLNTCGAKGDGTEYYAVEMNNKERFEGWDFTSIWKMGAFSPILCSNLETGKNNPSVIIENADELKAFRDRVNNGETFDGEYVLMKYGSYIDGSETDQWIPIGTAETPFKGTFDGNSCEITGLYIDGTLNYQGLFGYIGDGGIVKDVKVKGTVKGNDYVGGVAGYNGGLIENCSFEENVGGANNVGGLAGYNEGTIKNSCNKGGISGSGNAAGGVTGYNKGTVENCYNTAKVDVTGKYVGGVIGYNYYEIKDSYNTGSVGGTSYVGGLVGYNYNTIKNTYNTGSVSGTDNVGGVAGYAGSRIENSYNMGSVGGTDSYVGGIAGYVHGTIENTYNAGSVSGTNSYVGGIAGYNFGVVKNSYNRGKVKGTSSVGGAIGKNSTFAMINNIYYLDTCAADGTTFNDDTVGTALTAADMQKSESYAEWDFTDIWVMGYFSPMLKSIPETNTENSPAMTISTANDLKTFSSNVCNGTSYAGKYVILAADIDLGGSESDPWTPIGTESNQFKGKFIGNGYKISGLYVTGTADYQGLFGYIGSGGTVKDLAVDGTVVGENSVGGLAGINYGLIENCYFKGNVKANRNNDVGFDALGCIGGLAGYNNGTIKNSYNTGTVDGENIVADLFGEEGYIGGLAGKNYGTVENCYNTGTVVGNKSTGGVTGYNSGTIKNCYYLATCAADGTTFNNTQGTALTAADMKNSTKFENWDFTSTWVVKFGRPLLKSNIELVFNIVSVGASGTKATATVYIAQTGTYTVVFADYENGKLNNSVIAPITVAENGTGTVTVTTDADITLGTGDKVMIWSGVDTMIPMCDAYEVK